MDDPDEDTDEKVFFLRAVILWVLVTLLLLFPLVAILAPAHVSTSCDLLLESLNDLRPHGTSEHSQRVMHLRGYLLDLNRKQGLGFSVYGLVVDNRMLARITGTVLAVTWTATISLVQYGEEAAETALEMAEARAVSAGSG